MSKLTIQPEAYIKLRAYIDNCEKEISGLGKIVETRDGFELVDVVILEQEVTGATTNLDDNALGKFAFELHQRGEDMQAWSCWWHSHAKMSAFFSGTDESTILESNEQRYLVSLVGNHAGEWESRIDIFEPVHATSELDVEVAEPLEDEASEAFYNEVEALQERLSKKHKAEVKLYATLEPLENKKIVELCENQIKELVKEPAPTLKKWSKKYTPRTRQTPLWEQNGLTLDEYNRTYHNLTKRQRELLVKAREQALSDDEAIEVESLIDMLDNRALSRLDEQRNLFELGF